MQDVVKSESQNKSLYTGKPFVVIFADGACSGNPGVGGYGAILRSDTPKASEKEIAGFDPETTNNRMELTAVIMALEALKRPCRVKIVTDSEYVVRGMTKWMPAWLRNNWQNSKKKDVLNRDLWERLLQLSGPHEIQWEWVRGHNGHAENERCDSLAQAEIKKYKQKLKRCAANAD
jgi:ribonuclease HI